MPLPTAPFDATKSIFLGLAVIQLKLTPALSPVTSATDTLTSTAHGLSVGQTVIYVSGNGFTGLTALSTYFVTAVPTADTFKLSATVGGAAITVGTSTVGVFQPVLVFEAADLGDDPEQEIKYLDRPDYQGVTRHARATELKGFEKWTFGLDEVKRLLSIFGGALRGRKSGTCTLWIPDPTDQTGKVALKSENDFAMSVMRDGKMEHGNSAYSKTTIRIDSLKSGNVTWTADGTA